MSPDGLGYVNRAGLLSTDRPLGPYRQEIVEIDSTPVAQYGGLRENDKFLGPARLCPDPEAQPSLPAANAWTVTAPAQIMSRTPRHTIHLPCLHPPVRTSSRCNMDGFSHPCAYQAASLQENPGGLAQQSATQPGPVAPTPSHTGELCGLGVDSTRG